MNGLNDDIGVYCTVLYSICTVRTDVLVCAHAKRLLRLAYLLPSELIACRKTTRRAHAHAH